MKYVRWLFKLIGVLLVVSVVIYVAVIFPNDARIAGPFEVSSGPLVARDVRVVSMLNDRLTHSVDVEAGVYRKLLKHLATLLPDAAVFESVRFTSPYQLFLPIGTYPARLEARDGVFIPAGRTLTLSAERSSLQMMHFGLYAVGGPATLDVKVSSRVAGVATVTHPGPKGQSWLPRGVDRYLRPDQAALVDRWVDTSVPVDWSSDDRVTFSCHSTGEGCVVSDVRFDATGPTRENFLIILVDTLRGDGPNGGHAPNLQALASQSTVFQRALAPGNMTSPSTNAFLSCLKPTSLGSLAFSYSIGKDRREDFYRRKHVSFPGRFANAGYDTAMIGNVSVISEIYGVGIHHGFAEQISLETDAYDTPEITREVVQWLQGHGSKPFMLYVHFNGPHAPYRAPLTDIWSTFKGLQTFRSYPDMLYSLYQGEVRYTDRYVGKIMAAIDKLGLSERTNVVLTADHGDQHQLRQFKGNVAAPNFAGAYFDHGATLLNDEINVPLMIRRPSHTGRIVDRSYVSTLDVGPTLLELAGLPLDDCNGRSLATFLLGQPDVSQPPVIGSEGFKGRAIVFDNRYKYIHSYEATDKRVYAKGSWNGPKRLYLAPEQLFDLQLDPDETADLSKSERTLMVRARREYRHFYGIKDALELMIENPEGKEISVLWPMLTKLSELLVVEGDGTVTLGPHGGVQFKGSTSRRVLLRLAPLDHVHPKVVVDGKQLVVTASSLHLPIKDGPLVLPSEPSGIGSAPDGARDAIAYLRRVDDDGQEGRHIVTGNAQFEQVLREWGYLNDR